MSSANPPTYNFNGLNYNPQFYASSSSNINSALYVTTTTAQAISGQKTFTTSPVVPTVSTGDNSTNAASTAYVQNQGYLTVGTASTTLVDLTTSQTISGLKTFSTLPISTTSATTQYQLTNKNYVDTAITNNGVWNKDANGINYTAGVVGIGTGADGNSGLVVYRTGVTNYVRIAGDYTKQQGLCFKDTVDRWVLYKPDTTSKLSFYDFGSSSDRLTLTSTSVGINNYSPSSSYALDVGGSINSSATISAVNISTSGTAGIGTAAPSSSSGYGLQIYKTGTSNYVRIQGDVANQQALEFYDSASRWILYKQGTSQTFGFYDTTNSTDRMVLSGTGVSITGNLSVSGTISGTLSTSTTQQFSKISIGGAVAAMPLYVYNANRGTLSGGSYGALTTTGASTGTSFSNSLGAAFFDGAIHAAGVIYSTSDIRTKNIINDNLDSIHIIEQLNAVQYKWKDLSQGNQIYTGFIAQDVKKVFENCISYYEDFVANITQDAIYKDNKIYLINHGLLLDDEIQIFDNNRKCVNTKVTNILSPDEFEINEIIDTEKIFIFGKKVNDLHRIDYQSIFAVSVDATKKLIEKNRELENKVDKMLSFIQSKFPEFNLE